MVESQGFVAIGYGKEELMHLIEQAVSKALEKKEQSKEAEQFLNRQETAALCSVTVQTLNNWVKSGRLKSHRINGRVLFRRSDIDNALVERKIIKHTN